MDSELQAQAIQIKNIEMQNLDRYLQAIGTQAALIAGFAVTTLMCDSSIGFANGNPGGPHDIHWTVQIVYSAATMSCLCFEFYCVMSSTLVSVLGPTYALNGPKGSMHVAVKAMKEERIQILYSFGFGALCFGVSMIFTSWILMRAGAATVCSFLILITFGVIYSSVRRIGNKFKFESDANMHTDKTEAVSASDYLANQSSRSEGLARDKEMLGSGQYM